MLAISTEEIIVNYDGFVPNETLAAAHTAVFAIVPPWGFFS
jgi:hypothetical protein